MKPVLKMSTGSLILMESILSSFPSTQNLCSSKRHGAVLHKKAQLFCVKRLEQKRKEPLMGSFRCHLPFRARRIRAQAKGAVLVLSTAP